MRPRRSERGVTIILFAVGLTALLTLGGLVLSGSVGYSAVRNAQTAADAAALAGTSALQTHKDNWLSGTAGVSADDLAAEILSVAADNGAELVRCDLVRPEYARSPTAANVIGPCDGIEYLDDDVYKQAAGVRVEVSDTRDTVFSGFLGDDSISGTAAAAASAQPVGAMRVPFLLCSELTYGEPPLVFDASTSTHAVNPDAIGAQYVLWGNDVKEDNRDCRGGGGPSDWRGLADSTAAGQLGGWWKTDSGNKTGQLPARANGVGTCDLADLRINEMTGLIGCVIPVPICTEGNGSSSDFRLRCVAVAAFEITYAKGASTGSGYLCDDDPNTNVVCGKLLGAATADHGRGVAMAPDHQVVVVKLVE